MTVGFIVKFEFEFLKTLVQPNTDQICIPDTDTDSGKEELVELIRYAALIHNSVMTATEQWETSCLVNDAFGTTSWLFQDVNDVTFIVFHRVVCQRHLLH
jgi:hypothetical protein